MVLLDFLSDENGATFLANELPTPKSILSFIILRKKCLPNLQKILIYSLQVERKMPRILSNLLSVLSRVASRGTQPVPFIRLHRTSLWYHAKKQVLFIHRAVLNYKEFPETVFMGTVYDNTDLKVLLETPFKFKYYFCMEYF